MTPQSEPKPPGVRPRRPSRFRGLSPRARRFFEALEEEPCPPRWPAAERVTYAAEVLSPLKALVVDLKELLAHEPARIALEPRVGASLDTAPASGASAEECPVRRIRAWDARLSPERSPILYASFRARGIELGLAAEGGDPEATARVRTEILRSPSGSSAAMARQLEEAGWHVAGGPPAAEAVACVPSRLRPWIRSSGLEIQRILPWEAWLGKPSFAQEIARGFRELLPVFDLMRGAQGRGDGEGETLAKARQRR